MSKPETIRLNEQHTLEDRTNAAIRYFSDTKKSYVPFVVTADTKQFMIGCIDPRCECRKSKRNKLQTPGGAYGIGNDRQLAHMALTGSFINIQTALFDDASQRNTSTLDVHPDCKFWKFRQAINEEIGAPSLATENTVDDWRREIYYKDRVSDKIISELVEAGGEVGRIMTPGEQPEERDLIDFIKRLYPKHKNYNEMEGENIASAYVVSHLTNVGQDRVNKDPFTQAYFDSLGAIVHDIKNPGNDFRKKMLPRLVGAAMLRSAATQTVITNGDEGLVRLETRRKKKEISVDIIGKAA